MVNITLSLPDDLKKEMEQFVEINWSAVVRQSINNKIRELLFLKKFKEKSNFSEEDAVKLGRELNKTFMSRRKNEDSNRC